VRIILIATVCCALSSGFAAAQSDLKKDVNTPTGRSAPEEKGQLQPQGWTLRAGVEFRPTHRKNAIEL